MTKMLTVKGVAEELDVSTEHVLRLIRRGELSATNVATAGRPNYRVSRAQLDKFLREHATAA